METIIGVDGGGGAAPASGLIKDSGTADFARDVIEASMETPVIVDFWAPWCGPCKQLGPALEKAVQAARGAVRLVKIDIDRNQDLAAELRIQSIPTVYAFYQGRPVDGFQGALPESQIKAFIDRLAGVAGTAQGPNPVEQAIEQAEAALEGGQAAAASALFGQVLQHDPENARALSGMIRCSLAGGDSKGARRIYDGLTDEMKGRPELAAAAAALELADTAGNAGEIPRLKEQLARNENDHRARLDLALALYGANQHEAAADELLELIRRDRTWNEEAGRKQLLKLFEAWGPTNPLTLQTRRRLSALLFS